MHDLVEIIFPRLIFIMSPLLKLFILFDDKFINWVAIWLLASKNGILSAASFRIIRCMLSNSSNLKSISILVLYTLAEVQKLFPCPFKFMIPVSKVLIFLRMEVDIKLSVRRRYITIIRAQIPKNIFHCFLHIFSH